MVNKIRKVAHKKSDDDVSITLNYLIHHKNIFFVIFAKFPGLTIESVKI